MGGEEKYVGRIYRFDAKGDAVNCCSLAREFYSDHGWRQNWDDGIPWPKRPDGYEEHLKLYMDKEFRRCGIDDLEYGDIVMLNQRAGGGESGYTLETEDYYAWKDHSETDDRRQWSIQKRSGNRT